MRRVILASVLIVAGCDDGVQAPAEAVDAAVDVAIDADIVTEDMAPPIDAGPEADAGPMGPPPMPEGTVTRLAGGSSNGFIDGQGREARFNGITCIALSTDGATLYASDTFNGTVRAIDLDSRVVTTLSGRPLELASFDGPVGTARFTAPRGCAATADALFVADGPTLRRIALDGSAVSTLAGQAASPGNVDGPGADARLGYLTHDIEPSADGALLYLADRSNDTIRTFDVATGRVETLVGPEGGLNGPGGIVRVDDVLYVADTFDGELVRVDLTDGSVEVVAGGMDGPQGVTVDRDTAWLGGFDGVLHTVDLNTGDVAVTVGVAGDTRSVDGEQADIRLGGAFAPPVVDGARKQLYYVDLGSGGVRQLDLGFLSMGPLVGPVDPFGARDGDDPRFATLYDIVPDGDGWIVSDPLNNSVRAVDAAGAARTIAGVPGDVATVDGPVAQARFDSPIGLARDGARIYVADYAAGTVRLIDGDTVSTVAGPDGADGLESPWGLGLAPDGRLFVTEVDRGSVRVIEPDGRLGVAAPPGRFDTPLDVAVDPRDGAVYVADAVRAVVYRLADDGTAEAIVGQVGETGVRDGPLDEALLAGPVGLTFAPDGGLLVVDGENHMVRRIDLDAGIIERWLGHPTRHGGQAVGTALPWSEATLEGPQAVSVGPTGGLGIVSEFGITIAEAAE